MIIFIIDDHQMFAEAMRTVVQGFFGDSQIDVFTDPKKALESIDKIQPDLIILDLEMIGITGMIMLDILSQNQQNIPILICSGNLNEHNKQRVINAGAKGFLSKTEGMQQIREAIEALLAGKPYPKEACQYLSETQTSLLSNRQRIILGLMQSGLSNSEMAEALYVSTNTIKTHVRLMYNSLDVNSRIACINKARELGLIDPI